MIGEDDIAEHNERVHGVTWERTVSPWRMYMAAAILGLVMLTMFTLSIAVAYGVI